MPFEDRKFNVGDFVQVIDEPDWDCNVGWCDEMSQYCGQIARIALVRLNGTISLDIDKGRFLWSRDIVRLVDAPCNLPDLDSVPPEAFQILFG